jgi:hypothetical protein
MRPTLVLINHHEIAGRQFHHADELPPGFLSQDAINKLLDLGWLREMPNRRSLHRLLHRFSGCDERESLDKSEADAYTLSP